MVVPKIEGVMKSGKLGDDKFRVWVFTGQNAGSDADYAYRYDTESERDARPCHSDWVRDLVNQCRDSGVPVFVKQAGARPQGEGWDELLQIREVPDIMKPYFGEE